MDNDKAAIYTATWKPTLIKGVPRDYAIFSIIVVAIIAGLVGNIWIGLVLITVAWCYGYLRAKDDPEFFTVRAIRLIKLKPTKGNYKGREIVS